VFVLALLALVALLGLVAPIAPPPRQAASPSLAPTSSAPLTLRGTGFASGEAVRVDLLPGRGRQRVVRAARANAAGSFRVAYGLVALEPCRGVILAAATGSTGRRATWKRPCRPPHEQPPSLR
jgi:hypothetical protein